MTDQPATDARPFPFRPWVRNSCRRGLVWGLAILLLLAGLAWLFQAPGAAPLSRAFGVLVLYGVLFLATLAKIWWTAGRPAVILDGEALFYQTLHGFRPKRVPYSRVLAVAPQPGTHSLRLVVGELGGDARELFLNLAVIRGRHVFLDALGERLESLGLERGPGEDSWRRAGLDL